MIAVDLVEDRRSCLLGFPDKDGTVSKDEYLKLVEERFKAADRDNDGTLDDNELRSRAGRALLRLLQ